MKGFSEDVSRAYRALSLVARSQGFGTRGLSSLSYSQAYDRVLATEMINGKLGDVAGFMLSVGSTVNPAGLGVKMGIAALGIDLIQGDVYGTGIGLATMATPFAAPIDLGYGAYRFRIWSL